MANALRIHTDDNVVTALADLPAGAHLEVEGLNGQIATKGPVPFGHKIAIKPIAPGEHVVKYGASIGVATDDIKPGEHVHSHNLRSVRGAATS